MGVSGGGELVRGGGHPGMEDGSILGRGGAISITEGKRGKERRDQEEKKEGLSWSRHGCLFISQQS
jgi:hypothetical protein